MKKKIMLGISIPFLIASTIFAIPKDPHNFYGSVQVNSENITDTSLNIYVNGNLQVTKNIKNSYYGEGFDKAVLNGNDDDLIEFELVSNECSNSDEKINYTFSQGQVTKLDLDFNGVNTCNNQSNSTDTTTPDNSNDNYGSNGGSPSSSGGGGGGGKTPTNTNDADSSKNNQTSSLNNSQIVPEYSVAHTQEKPIQTQEFVTNDNTKTQPKQSNVEVITNENDLNQNNPITTKSVEGISGNITKSTKNSLFGLGLLAVLLISFIIWRQNKKKNLKNKQSSNSSNKNKPESEDSEN